MAEQCRYIRAAYPTMADDDLMCAGHRHEPRVFALARSMATVMQQPEPTDEQIAWFLDDADEVVDDFTPTPQTWTVTEPEVSHEPGLDWTLSINGQPYIIQEADGEPAHPVRRETWESWVADDADDEAQPS